MVTYSDVAIRCKHWGWENLVHKDGPAYDTTTLSLSASSVRYFVEFISKDYAREVLCLRTIQSSR
jgi:hypothetical protein